jgi:hypothetical protein
MPRNFGRVQHQARPAGRLTNGTTTFTSRATDPCTSRRPSAGNFTDQAMAGLASCSSIILRTGRSPVHPMIFGRVRFPCWSVPTWRGYYVSKELVRRTPPWRYQSRHMSAALPGNHRSQMWRPRAHAPLVDRNRKCRLNQPYI